MALEYNLSRRNFLVKAFGFTSGLLLSGIPSDSAPITQFPEQTSNPKLDNVTRFQSYLSNRFGILFHNPSDRVDRLLLPKQDCGEIFLNNRSINWDLENLNLFYQVIKSLPKKLYSPSTTDEGILHHLGITLVDKPTLDPDQPQSSMSKHLKFPDGEHLLLFSPSRLQQSEGKIANTKKRIVHEFCHYTTSQKIEYYNKNICEPLGINNIDTLRTIFDRELKTIVEEEIDDCNNPTGEIREKLKSKNHIGYGAMSFGEFFSVAGEYYYEGADKFVKSYSPFFKEQKATQFYTLMRRFIFDPTEY